MCCWCPPSYWDVRTRKCYAGTAVISGLVLVVAAIVVPFFLPTSLDEVAASQAKNVLAIPAQAKASSQLTAQAKASGQSTPQPEAGAGFTYADWLDNSNPKWHPPSYREFFFYNITNTDILAVLNSTEKIKVEKVGPIAFKKKWQRFPDTVEFSENNDRVCYEFGIEFEFDASRSQEGLTPDSVLQMLNVPYFGALVQASNLIEGGAGSTIQTYVPLMCSRSAQIRPELQKSGPNQWFDNCSVAAEVNSFEFTKPNQCHACLFNDITIKDLLFGAESNTLNLLFRANSLDQGALNSGNSPMLFATSAPLFHNCTSQKECYNEKAVQASYGLGGTCQEIATDPRFEYDIFASNLLSPGLCLPPANITTRKSSIRQCQYTGLNDDCFINFFDEEHCAESKVRQFSEWMGNTSTNLWGYEHPVKGAFDQEPQFHPFVQDDDTLSLWIPDVMRSFDITYESDQDWRGLKLKRFKPVDSIFGINGSAHDAGYGQEDTPPGFINATATLLVKYGVPVPMYLSQPGYAGADLSDPMLTAVDCFVKGDDGKEKACEPSSEGIYVDIEPTFGKVVRGSAGAQVNFKLENKYFDFKFGILQTLSPFVDVASEGDIMLPFLIFSDVALAQEGQTNLIENSLAELKLLPSVPWIFFAVLMALGGSLIIIGTFFYGKIASAPTTSLSFHSAYSAADPLTEDDADKRLSKPLMDKAKEGTGTDTSAKKNEQAGDMPC